MLFLPRSVEQATQADEVLVKGHKKGVASAKSKLLEAVEFGKEPNSIVMFTIPTHAIVCILGKSRASINEIMDEMDAQIDVDKANDYSSSTNITICGSKKVTLHSYGVQVNQSVHPQKSVIPPHPAPSVEAHIDDSEDNAVIETQWQVPPNYLDAESDSQWTLKSPV